MHAKQIARIWLIFALCHLLSACAGYRGGWESMAYVGNTPPIPVEYRTSYEAAQRAELILPGLRLQVALNNQLRTYDTHVYFFVVPLMIDPRNVYVRDHEPGKTHVQIQVVASEPGFVFKPELAVLNAGGESFKGSAGYESAYWDAQGRRVTSGGVWERRPNPRQVELTELGRRYLFSVEFDTPIPSPESNDISVDLSAALRAAGQPPLPLIRFLPVRWKEGYT